MRDLTRAAYSGMDALIILDVEVSSGIKLEQGETLISS